MQANSNISKLKQKRKCKNYSVIEKLNILQELDKNVSVNAIAQQYDVDARTIRNWKKSRSQLEELCRNNFKTKRKRQRKLPFEIVDKAVLTWFEEMRLRLIPITGSLIKAKALEFAREMNISNNFVASEGWLSNWKARNDIGLLTICSEKSSADDEAAKKIKKELEENIEEDLTLTQIFKVHETNLNYKLLPSRTLVRCGECQASGFKQSKDHVTVMICSNADGSLKLPVVVIGKSINPRKLKNIPKNMLPVYYTSHKSAWMNFTIFEQWFKEEFVIRVTTFLKEKNLPLKAILYLDNASRHPSVETLAVNDIKVSYLPQNTTSLIQLMDQGIIENLKRYYRSLLVHYALNAQKNGIDIMTFIKFISIKDFIYWISDAWISINPAIIKKCWNKLSTKFLEENEKETNVLSEIDITDNDLLNYVCQLNNYEDITEDNVRDWIMKTDYCFAPIISNDEIIQMATENDISESESEIKEENVTPQEAIFAANTLISFYERYGSLTVGEFAVLRKCRNIVVMFNTK